MDQLIQYVFPAAVILFFGWRWLKFRRTRKVLPELLQRGAQIVDVRSPSEFASGHFPGSQNIPLSALSTHAKQLNKDIPVILCCASGTRSGMGVGILRSHGFKEIFNAGPWQNLLACQSKT